MKMLTVLDAWLLGGCARCGGGIWHPLCPQCSRCPPASFTTPQGVKIIALGAYSDTPGDLARRLKYEEESVYAGPLGRTLSRFLPPLWKASTIVPVPLHPERLAERGYNQAALLGRRVAASQGLAFSTSILRRNRKTMPQAQLRRYDRIENTSGAFSSAKGHGEIVLVDDVVTTGHTIDACAEALGRSGFRIVGGLAIALARESDLSAR